MVNYEWPPLGGGGGIAMADIAEELSTRHSIHVLTSGTPDLRSYEKSPNGNLLVFRARVFSRSARAVAGILSMLTFYPSGILLGRRLLRQHKYDAMNTWFAIPSGPIGVHIAAHGKIPHLVSLVGGDLYDPSKWYSPHRNPVLRRVVDRVIAKADRLTAISEDIAERATKYFKVKSPIDVIPLGIKRPDFQPSTREELGLHDQNIYIICVGRLVRRKDHPTLLRALALLKRGDVHLLLVGDGPEHIHLAALAQKLSIASQVHFLGFVSEEKKYQLLATSDVFAMPSLHEGFGLVYLEAMHCGLPVIASRQGGQEEFLEDGKTGFLVTAGDCKALQRALEKLIADPGLRKSLGASNRELVKRYYISRTAEMYENLLEEMLHDSRSK